MIKCRWCRRTITWNEKWCEWLDANNAQTCWGPGSMSAHEPLIPNLRVPGAVRRWLETS